MALAGSIGRSGAAPGSAPPAAALIGLGAAVLAFVAVALRRRSAALGGLAAGLCYGVGDVTSKAMLIGAAHHPRPPRSPPRPLLYATAGAHGLGFVLLQRAFQHGGAIASLGPMTAAMNLLPMAAGVLLLGERLPAGGLDLALRLGAFAAAVAGAWVARRSQQRLRPSSRPVARRLAATLAPDCGPVRATMPAQPEAPATQRAIRVVAADDHAAYLRATTETLTRAGLGVVGISTTGQGAIDDVRTHAPDVALVDLRMPGLSGADVARAVRARYPATRVVILSAYDDEEIVQLAIAAGATGYVTKDSTPEEIVRAVYRAADGEPTLPR